MANSDSEGMDVHIQGEASCETESRATSQFPMPAQKPTLRPPCRPPPDPWPVRQTTATKDNVSNTPMVVSNSDPKHPAKVVRSCMSAQRGKAAHLPESIRSWETYPTNKSSSTTYYNYSMPVSHRRPGASDPRFRKVVGNRKPKVSDVGTDTEDLSEEKLISATNLEKNVYKGTKDSECKYTKPYLIAREKAEKPEDASVPLKKVLSIDCGVQTVDIESTSPGIKTFTSKGPKHLKRSGSEVPQQHISEHFYSTKPQVNQENLKQSTVDDAEWQTIDVQRGHQNMSKDSVIFHSKGYSSDRENKCPDNDLCSHRDTRVSATKKISVKCCCNNLKRRAKDSITNLSLKGNGKRGKEFCVRCNCMKKSSEVLADHSRRIVMLVLGGVFVITASFWLLSILMQFIPLINEWLYPPPEKEVMSVLGLVSSWFSEACSSIYSCIYSIFFKPRKCSYVGERRKCQ